MADKPVREFAKDMKSELHVTPTVRKVIIVSLLIAVLMLGTCVLFNPFAVPAHSYNPVQERAETAFDTLPPPAETAPAASPSGTPPDVYTPPPAP